jgi:hypothetical protein
VAGAAAGADYELAALIWVAELVDESSGGLIHGGARARGKRGQEEWGGENEGGSGQAEHCSTSRELMD